VTLLQQRLPALLARKRAIDKCRADATRWWPWLSRLATVVALVHTRQGLQLAKEYAAAQVQVLGVRP
jgi:hypothetical protein